MKNVVFKNIEECVRYWLRKTVDEVSHERGQPAAQKPAFIFDNDPKAQQSGISHVQTFTRNDSFWK